MTRGNRNRNRTPNNNNKKRNNSEVSPENVNVLPAEKRADDRDSPSGTGTGTGTSYTLLDLSHPDNSFVTMATGYGVPPTNMANFSNMNNYQTHQGGFYSPPPPPPTQAQQQPPYVASPQSAQSNEAFQRQVLDNLASLNQRLNKLDTIEKQLSTMTSKITSIDTRVTSLESSVKDVGSKMNDIEASRAFDTQVCDEIQKKQSEIDKTLKSERDKLTKLSAEYRSLKSLPDEIDDLRSRSMRNNLLFHGFDEGRSAEDRRAENSTDLVYNYLENTLNIADAKQNIKIERAHRISKYEHDKSRPIVAMFNHFPDKIMIKKKSQLLWKNFRDSTEGDSTHSATPPKIRISDQFSKTVQEKRKVLIPVMIKAKNDGKNANLAHDKLYINGKMYTVDTVHTSEYS